MSSSHTSSSSHGNKGVHDHDTTTHETVTLRPQEELRFEVSSDETLTLTLKNGNAEIFGAELAV